MADLVDGLTVQQVANESVSMRTDDEQIDRVFLQMADKFARAIGTVQEGRDRVETDLGERLGNFVEVTSIGAGLQVGGLLSINAG